MRIRELIVAAGMSLLFVSTYSAVKNEATEPSLWTIQKLLASKKYVDLTHEFAPGIPHWRAFRTKRVNRFTGMTNDRTFLVSAFSLSCLRMSANRDSRRSACSFHQRVAHGRSDRSQGNDPAPGGC